MTKRADQKFARIERDVYDTPEIAAQFLRPYLGDATTFFEPCAGNGSLTTALVGLGLSYAGSCDIAPRSPGIRKLDALKLTKLDVADVDLLITNPPYQRELMHRLIEHFRQLKPTWLLLELDWCATEQAAPYMDYCSAIVAVGRLRFIENSLHSGYDNYAWCRFRSDPAVTHFYPRRKPLP